MPPEDPKQALGRRKHMLATKAPQFDNPTAYATADVLALMAEEHRHKTAGFRSAIQALLHRLLVTLLRYEMLAPHDMQLSIFDLRGRVVSMLSSGFRQAGTYQVTWSGRNRHGQPVPSGLYFARLQVGNERLTRKILLAK